ncbi:serine carboxypeptidase II-3-like [Aristolochia californica]|uniref:serine carboxypeptidase II-3-like n=1 Tax=Aristolochia californica TaxID=171875 RepID=UPI0035DA0AAF
MKSGLVFFFFASLLGSSVVFRSQARQGDALARLLKTKKKDSKTGLFETRLFSPDRVIIRQAGSKEKDRIMKLPGQPANVDFAQYGGYITVNDESGRALFYYFAEAVGQKQSSRPLLLWLNGGPGCSSIGYGAMEELGPFRVMSDGKTLYRNPYAWNNVANVLFLESPAGVGYSYSNTTSDYKLSGDQRTAEDAYIFLVNWLERFPEYKNRDLYLSGESYAGHYVPQLAHTILLHNKSGKNSIINLKGITIGNAAVNDETDTRGMFDYFWTHALISDETIDQVHTSCDFTPNATVTTLCHDAVAKVSSSVRPLDIYNIYAPLCRSSHLTAIPKKASVVDFDPCSDYYIENYLNLPQVQKALHANVTKLDHPWSPCSIVIDDWNDSPSSTLPLLKELIKNGIRVWVYSGDTDGRVPITSTRYSLGVLKLAVKKPWAPWSVNGEVGGYGVVYQGGLTLVTVRGAGHEVPSYQPERAQFYIDAFLKGKLPPPP